MERLRRAGPDVTSYERSVIIWLTVEVSEWLNARLGRSTVICPAISMNAIDVASGVRVVERYRNSRRKEGNSSPFYSVEILAFVESEPQ